MVAFVVVCWVFFSIHNLPYPDICQQKSNYIFLEKYGLGLVTGEKEGLLLFLPKQRRGTLLPLPFHSQRNEHCHYAGQ